SAGTAAKKAAPKKAAATRVAAKKKTRGASGAGRTSKTAAAKKGAAAKAETRAGRRSKPARAPSARAIAPTVAEERADEDLVERSIALLDEHEERVADAALAVGAHLFESYFAGDEALARSRVPAKPLSYDRLVARAEAETSWDAADLRRALVAALVHRSLPADIAERVPASYLARLDAVGDPAERAALAARIADGELRGRPAEEAIALASHAPAGRSRVPGPLRLANALSRLVDRASHFGGFDGMEARGLDELARAAPAGRLGDVARSEA